MRVHLATSVEHALRLKRDAPQLAPIAGGTDLLVHWGQAQAARRAPDLLDLSGLDELRRVAFDDGVVELGALVSFWDVVLDARFHELPLLPQAARTVGAVQIQTRGTWAGNVANASPAADGVAALMAHDAEVVLASAEGRRSVPLSRFYRGYKQMELRADEIIVSLRLPRRSHDVARFIKVGARAAQAIAKVGVAIAHSAAGWRVVAASVAPTVRRCPAVERLLERGAPIEGPEALLPAIRADVAPIDDMRSTAAYRERVLCNVLYHAIVSDSRGAA